jgi:hypothetical protein
LNEKQARKTGPVSLKKITRDETIETIGDISRKNSAPRKTITDATPTADKGDRTC